MTTWQDLYPGRTAISAARIAGGYPLYTEEEYASMRANLYQRALEQDRSREELAEIDFANIARQLVKAAVAEQKEQDKKWRTQK